MNGRCENKNPIEDAIALAIYKRKTYEPLNPCPGVTVIKTNQDAGKEQYVAVKIARPIESKKEVSEWLDAIKDLGDWNVLPGCGEKEVFVTVDYVNFPFPLKPVVEFDPSPHILIEQLKKSLELED
jgi:hypothetical protein